MVLRHIDEASPTPGGAAVGNIATGQMMLAMDPPPSRRKSRPAERGAK